MMKNSRFPRASHLSSLPACVVALSLAFLPSCANGANGVAPLNKTSAKTATKSADSPARFRDFQIYATSAPAAGEPARIVMTVQLHNNGARALTTAVKLGANAKAGFAGGGMRVTIPPRGKALWTVNLRPADDLHREVLNGDISFGAIRERELFIALQGPDGADFSNSGVYRNVKKITDKAEVVGTYAPRVATNPAPAQGRSNYRIVAEPMPQGEKGAQISPESWGKLPNLKTGEAALSLAVSDLQRCLKLMSGAQLEVTNDAKTATPAIRVRINANQKWAHPDAYHLFTRGKDIIIESGTFDGLTKGLYGLLTDYLDCHWFQPGEVGEEIPRPANQTVSIARMNDLKRPSFFSSGGGSFGAQPHWDARNRSVSNRGRMNFGHSWFHLVPPTDENIKNHPNWFARDPQGKVRYFNKIWSWTNFCTTEPEVIEMVARKINEQLKNPDMLVASLEPNDSAPFCQCPRCLALDASYGVKHDAPHPIAGPYDVVSSDGLRVTDRLLHFSQEIHKRLEPQNREKFLGILAYNQQIEPPVGAKPHAHHVSMVCDIPWNYDHSRPFTDPTSAVNRDLHRILTSWGKIVPQLGFYDYYGHYEFLGPWGLVHKIREDLPAFRDLGGTFLMLEAQSNFALHGLNLYVASRLSWDVDADVDGLLEEYYAKYYGPAAPAMRKFWDGIERTYALTRPGTNTMERVGTNAAMWPELDGYLKEAETLVAKSAPRFRDRVAFNRDGFDLGRQQFSIMTKYFLPGRMDNAGAVNYAGANEEIASFRGWLVELKKKYAATTGYYPTAVVPYVYPEIDKMMVEVETKAKAKNGAPPLATPNL